MNKPDSHKYFKFKSIRIKPHLIEFERVLEGEVLYKKFTIQNTGKHSVFVRIPSLNHQFFKVMPAAPRGEHLPPGLSLKKTIKFTSGSDDGQDDTTLPIFLNDQLCKYPIVRKPHAPIITISPKELHFGVMDCGAMQKFLTIYITNDGTKVATYHVDISKVSRVVSAEPVKGHVKPGCTVEILFKVVSFKTINLNSTINIKCDSVVTRIPITANIILTHLQSVHENTTEFFTLIEFPPTYYGLTSTEILLVKNISEKIKMFCIKPEFKYKCIEVDAYRKMNPDFDAFQIRPDSGLFTPDETKIFVITFSPSRHIHHMDITKCYFATVLIKAFRCAHLDMSHYDIFEEPTCVLVSRKQSQETERSLISNVSFSSLRRTHSSVMRVCSTSALASITSFQDRIDMADYFNFLEHEEKDLVRVHVYGTPEVPGIEIIPDVIIIKQINVNHREVRVLEIKNKSQKLPIYVHYKKIPFVEVKPDNLLLKPSQSLQISIVVTPKNIGLQEMLCVFELLYHNTPKDGDNKMLSDVKLKVTFEAVTQTKQPRRVINTGLTPNYIKEVGKHCQNLKFNTKLQPKPKAITVRTCRQIDPNTKDLVALPNDTQRSLRPWRSQQPCKTIFTKQSRYSAPLEKDYELSTLEKIYKEKVITYYNSLLKRKPLEKSELILKGEYSLTKTSKVLMEDFKFPDIKPIERKETSNFQFFLPLNPMQMNKILVWPSAIRTGQVAANHAYSFTLKINNTNDFDIRIIIKSDKPNIFFFHGNRFVITRNSEKEVNALYKTFTVGCYNSNLDLIVNESMVLTVPIFAHVTPKAINLKVHVLTFEDHSTLKFIELTNKLNIRISFTWMIVNNNFSIEPCTGSVHASSKLICMVRFSPEIEGPPETEATLHSGEASVKKIKLIAEVKVQNLKLITKKIFFKNVPLNKIVMRKAIVKNPLTYPLLFRIDDTEISNLITIYPLQGTVQPLCHYAIYLSTIKIVNCIEFSLNVKIHTVGAGDILLPICGNTVFPQIEILPNVLKLKRIPAYTKTSGAIKFKNVCPAPVSIKLDMLETNPFYKIRQCSKWDSNEVQDLYLLPSQDTTVYVHFEPEFVICYDFYLPIVVNDIIGPPLLTDYISTKTGYYLVATYDGCNYTKVPTTIPCCKIQSFATVPKFEISPMYIKFTTNVLQAEAQCIVNIKNRQSIKDYIYIQTDYLSHPLSLTDKRQGHLNSYAYNIMPDEEIELIVSFEPRVIGFGKIKCKLPIYVESETMNKVYTAILIDGNYEKPKIFITYPQDNQLAELPQQVRLKKHYIVYFRALPTISIDVLNTRIIHLEGHLDDCKVTIETDIKELCMKQVGTREEISANYYTVKVLVSTNLPETFQCDGVWKVSCSCGGDFIQRIVGTLESSVLTNYAFTDTYWRKLIKLDPNGKLIPPKLDCTVDCTDFFRTYPFIPQDNSALATLLSNAVSAVETWTKTQIFYGERYYQIPSGICFITFSPPSEIAIKRKTRVCSIPFGQIFITLAGPQMYDYLGLTSDDVEDSKKVSYLMSVYQKGLNFLKEHGASLSYVRPEYLLDYSDFMTYKETMYEETDDPQPLTASMSDNWSFFKIAMASWLDVLIQIFKVFCMTRIRNTFYSMNSKSGLNELEFSVSNHVQKLPGVLSETESLLLSWLEYHFNKNKSFLWNENLAKRNILLYGEDLKDGLVYTAVTASYCPYMIPYFKDLYVDACSYEEFIHNNNVLIQCWEKLNYSFHITSAALVDTNSIRTMMFVAYLFEVLPSMYPTDTLTFKAPLSETTTQKFLMSNNNEFPIAYQVVFIGNEKQCFKTDFNFIVIASKSSKSIVVTYIAKFAEQTTSTLLLSGECTGYKYAKNKCISLEGNPDFSKPSSIITYIVHLYEIKEIKLTIQSPYKIDATYQVQQTYDEIVEPLQLTNIVYHNTVPQCDCGRLTLTTEKYVFDDDGEGSISGIIIGINNVDISTWLFFRNSLIGDFSIKVVTIVRDSKENEELTLTVPTKQAQLRLEIPLKNNLFVRCMKKLLLKITKDKEYQLWKRIIETPMGINILWKLYQFSLYDETTTPVHCQGGAYIIQVSSNANVELPEIVQFPNECDDGTIPIPFKVKNEALPLENFYMTLTSKESKRKRFYYVRIVKKIN